MKAAFFILITVFIFFANTLFAQNKIFNLVGTKWIVKDVELRITSGSIEDSLKERRFYQKFDSIKINFHNKKYVIVSWKQYKISAMYRIKKTTEGKVLVFTKWKDFGFYENGSFERSEFAVFLYPFKSRDIPFLDNCSFMMLSKSGGIDRQIFYKKVE